MVVAIFAVLQAGLAQQAGRACIQQGRGCMQQAPWQAAPRCLAQKWFERSEAPPSSAPLVVAFWKKTVEKTKTHLQNEVAAV